MIWAWFALVALVGAGWIWFDARRRRCPCVACWQQERIDLCRMECRTYQGWTKTR